MIDAGAARAHLRVLAREPRPAGGVAEASARAYCAEQLAAHGFVMREEPFEYSGLPGRYGTPVVGGAALLGLLFAARLGGGGRPGAALATLACAGALMGLAALALARWGVMWLPFGRERSVNLVGTRGTPEAWLVAHLDSKSQPVPILVRALGVSGMLVVWCGAVLTATFELLGREMPLVWPWIASAGTLTALPVIASVVRARSAGALDNASGVAAVLLAATALPSAIGAGVLLTSAEELGLAGARAWARSPGRAAGRAINFDGLDDDGALRYTWTGRRPTRLLDRLRTAARDVGLDAHVGRLVPGVLLDGVALADAGWEVVTVSKGSWRTVARIHTSRDDLASLDGSGLAEAAAVAAAALGAEG